MHEFIQEGKIRIVKENVIGKIEHTSERSKKRQRLQDTDAISTNTLFYNPAQVFNRDISLVALKVFGERRLREAFARFDGAASKRHVAEEVKGLSVCEPLAATGLRSLRYAAELPRSIFRHVTTSDLDAFAVHHVHTNRALNNVPEGKMTVVHAEATELLHSGKYICGQATWDVIDVDPYGTASPFVEAAISAVKDGGMLCITSTDMPVLGGNAPDVAFYKYGGCTVKARYLHEMALRLVVHQLQMTAAKCRRFVTPLLSLSVDFYVRIFVQVWDKPMRCSEICLMTAIVYQCSACDFFVTAPFGSESGKPKPHSRKMRKLRKENVISEDPEVLAPLVEDDATTGPVMQKIRPRCALYSGQRQHSGKAGLGRIPSEITGTTCPECGATLVIGGPFYAGPLHDSSFVDSCLCEMEKAGLQVSELLLEAEKSHLLNDNSIAIEIENGFIGSSHVVGKLRVQEKIEVKEDSFAWVKLAKDRFEYEMTVFRFENLSPAVKDKLSGVLRACQEDLPDVPFFYNLASICNHARTSMIKLDKFKSALLNLGYRVGLFHREPLSIKTDAATHVVYDILRGWLQRASQESSEKRSERTPPNYLGPTRHLSFDEINFNYHPNLRNNKGKNCPRWLPNPTSHWGPGKRAGKRHTELRAQE